MTDEEIRINPDENAGACEKQPAAEEKTEKASQEAEEKPKEGKAPEEASKDETESLKQLIKEQEGQIAKLKNAYAMAYADTENTRKRLAREYDNHMKYHLQSFALEILPVLDNCERALAIPAKDDTDETYRKAFEMVWKNLSAALKKEGVEEIEALGQDYDPNWMQAMMMVHEDGVEPGKVTEVLQKGYKIKDRLLRAAMVKVSE